MSQSPETRKPNYLGEYRAASARLALYVHDSDLVGSRLESDATYQARLNSFLAKEAALDKSLGSVGVILDLEWGGPGPSPVMQPGQSDKDTLQTPLN